MSGVSPVNPTRTTSPSASTQTPNTQNTPCCSSCCASLYSWISSFFLPRRDDVITWHTLRKHPSVAFRIHPATAPVASPQSSHDSTITPVAEKDEITTEEKSLDRDSSTSTIGNPIFFEHKAAATDQVAKKVLHKKFPISQSYDSLPPMAKSKTSDTGAGPTAPTKIVTSTSLQLLPGMARIEGPKNSSNNQETV